MSASINFVSAILLTTNDYLILQRRDRKANTVDPGMISIFAGKVKPGETNEEAVKREIKEETGLENLDFEPFGSMSLVDRVSHVFIVKNVDLKAVKVNEGQGYVTVKDKTDYLSVRQEVAPISKKILDKYFSA